MGCGGSEDRQAEIIVCGPDEPDWKDVKGRYQGTQSKWNHEYEYGETKEDDHYDIRWQELNGVSVDRIMFGVHPTRRQESWWGKTYLQNGRPAGYASYHFESPETCYIGYELAPDDWRLDDGSPVSKLQKKAFEEVQWTQVEALKPLTFAPGELCQALFFPENRLVKYNQSFDEDLVFDPIGEFEVDMCDGLPEEYAPLWYEAKIIGPGEAPGTYEVEWTDHRFPQCAPKPKPKGNFMDQAMNAATGAINAQINKLVGGGDGCNWFEEQKEKEKYVFQHRLASRAPPSHSSIECCEPQCDPPNANRFQGKIRWNGDATWDGDTLWDYDLFFSVDANLIIDGTIKGYNSDGNLTFVEQFCDPDGLLYVAEDVDPETVPDWIKFALGDMAFTKHRNTNCFDGHGGSNVDLAGDNANPKHMSLGQAKAVCLENDHNGFTYARDTAGMNVAERVWMLRDVTDPEQFADGGGKFDVYVRTELSYNTKWPIRIHGAEEKVGGDDLWHKAERDHAAKQARKKEGLIKLPNPKEALMSRFKKPEPEYTQGRPQVSQCGKDDVEKTL